MHRVIATQEMYIILASHGITELGWFIFTWGSLTCDGAFVTTYQESSIIKLPNEQRQECASIANFAIDPLIMEEGSGGIAKCGFGF